MAEVGDANLRWADVDGSIQAFDRACGGARIGFFTKFFLLELIG